MSWIKLQNFLINKDNISRIKIIDEENQHAIEVITVDGKSTTFSVEGTKYPKQYQISMIEFITLARKPKATPKPTNGRPER